MHPSNKIARDQLLEAVKEQDLYTVQLILDTYGQTLSDETLQQALAVAKKNRYKETSFNKKISHNINIYSQLAWYMRNNNHAGYNTPNSKIQILKTALRASFFGLLFTGGVVATVGIAIQIIPALTPVSLATLTYGATSLALVASPFFPLLITFAVAAAIALAFVVGRTILEARKIIKQNKEIEFSNTDLVYMVLNGHPNALRRLLIDTKPDPKSENFKMAINLAQYSEYKDDIRKMLTAYEKSQNANELPVQELLFAIPYEVNEKIQELKKDPMYLGQNFNKPFKSLMDNFLKDLIDFFTMQATIIQENNDIKKFEALHRDWKHIMNATEIDNKSFLKQIETYLNHVVLSVPNIPKATMDNENPDQILPQQDLITQFTSSKEKLQKELFEIKVATKHYNNLAHYKRFTT